VTEGIKVEDGIAVIVMPMINGYRRFLQCDNLLIQLRLNFYNSDLYNENVIVADIFFAQSSNPNLTFEPDIPPFNVDIDDYFERTHTLGSRFEWVDRGGNGLIIWAAGRGKINRLSDFQKSQYFILEFESEPARNTVITWMIDWIAVGNDGYWIHSEEVELFSSKAVVRQDNTFIIDTTAMRGYEYIQDASSMIDLVMTPYPDTMTDAYFADRVS
jgi:hypothetical protein